MSSSVSRIKAASPIEASEYFSELFKFETDCWDVHHAIVNKRKDFVLLDVRSTEDYDRGHITGALSIPHTRISASFLTQFSADTLFIVYCAGPHCNGADKAALRLAKLEVAVKKMIGGICGWKDEGFLLEHTMSATTANL